MTKIKLLLSGFCMLLFITSKATTWDEPWQDKVIQQAGYFVLAKIKDVDENKGVSLEIIKSLGGEALTGKIEIKNFSLLDLCSSSGHGATFELRKADSCYFFISKNKKGAYCIATPTAGYAYVNKGKVSGTFRHSYHRAVITVEIYEKTMTAIFNNYHNLSYDTSFINSYLDKYLNLKPARLNKEELDTLYLQHVAMESIYHLKLNKYENQLLKFLNDTANWHNQVSAARALSWSTSPLAVPELLKRISDTSDYDFVKVMCIWALQKIKPIDIKAKLEALEANASTEESGFGGDIMDPRVCTYMPTVKSALKKLIDELTNKKA